MSESTSKQMSAISEALPPALAVSPKRPWLFGTAGVVLLLTLGLWPGRALAQRPLGIDVSGYQGSGIDWTSVKNSGVAFAWAKATEGVGFNDADFGINEVNAKAAGVLIGAYHFARYDLNSGTSGAINEANYFWSVARSYIQADGSYLMPMLDLEWIPINGTSYDPGHWGYTKTSFSQWANAWCQTLCNAAAAAGVTIKPVIYTATSFAGSWLDSTTTQWTPWLAAWNGQSPQTGAPSPTSPWSTWTVWQYSDGVSVPGAGTVDGDVFNGTSASLVSTLVVGGVNITNQPVSVTVATGAAATFKVGATGSGSLRYQWRFNQANIAGATASAYTLPSSQLANAGGYSVVVTNTIGSAPSATAFLSVVSELTNAAGCIVAPPGMVDWWPAEGNPDDISGSLNAMPKNGFSYVTGKQGLAFHFDGSTSYLSDAAPSLSPPWTACLWVNRQNAPGPGAALISDGTYELKLEQYNGTRQVGLTQFGVGDYSFGYIVPAGVWTHLALVGTSSGTSLYVNGVLYATLSQSLPLPRAYIGAGYVASSSILVDYLLGSLDEILLFNRALSSAEIHAIYLAGSAGLVRVPEFTGMGPIGNGQFRLNLRGQTGKSLTIYASPDLAAWTTLGAVANPTGATVFTDTAATNAHTFYRAFQP